MQREKKGIYSKIFSLSDEIMNYLYFLFLCLSIFEFFHITMCFLCKEEELHKIMWFCFIYFYKVCEVVVIPSPCQLAQLLLCAPLVPCAFFYLIYCHSHHSVLSLAPVTPTLQSWCLEQCLVPVIVSVGISVRKGEAEWGWRGAEGEWKPPTEICI